MIARANKNLLFEKIIVKKGDHNLERPDMAKQWIEKAVNFIKI